MRHHRRQIFRETFPVIWHKEDSEALGWWLSGGISAAHCKRAYQPIGAENLATSYINLANPGTYDAAPGVAPTWNDVDGWIFDRTSQYLDTSLVPAAGMSAIVRFVTAGGDAWNIVIGSITQWTARFYLAPRNIGPDTHDYGNGNGSSYNHVAGLLTSGIMAIAGVNCYLNGVADGVVPNNTIPGEMPTVFIGACHVADGAAYLFGGSVQAIAFYDIDISAYITALTAAMNALGELE